MLVNSLFGAVKLVKNADFDKYKYFGYGIGFSTHGGFSLSGDSEFGKNVIFALVGVHLCIMILIRKVF